MEIDTDYLDNHGTNAVVCGPWKTHAVLLCLILITTVLMHPVCTGAPDHGHAVTSTMMRVGHNSEMLIIMSSRILIIKLSNFISIYLF